MHKSITILDGGMGRELKRMGAPFRQPEWSALALIEAPQFVEKAHDAFVSAGAQVITTNSYAVVPFHIGEDRFNEWGVSLARLAAQTAQKSAAKATGTVKVAGSLPPALGSYRPDLFEESESIRIHRALIEGMRDHVDVWLAETQSSIAEVRAVRKALGEDGKPLWISFTLDDEKPGEDVSLRSGETVGQAVREALNLHAAAILFNCSQPEVMGSAVRAAMRTLEENGVGGTIPIGVYANAFPPQRKNATANAVILDIRDDLDPDSYVRWTQRWVAEGATIVGGCCGISPEHIAKLARTDYSSPSS